MHQPRARSVWELARRQHGAVARQQLLALGLSRRAIEHRLATGRLHPVAPGVYAVGRSRLGVFGRWWAALLCCGEGAVLSHESAAALFGIGAERGVIEATVPRSAPRRRAGIKVHRRPGLRACDLGFYRGVPVTSPAQTLVDLAPRHDRITVERFIDEADRLELISPPELRENLADRPPEPGTARLRDWLDRRTFRLTRSKLERYFLPLAKRAGLPIPETKAWVNGYEVDFHWPELRLVVEADGLRHHRTPAQQSRDHARDQAHVAAGYTSLRFTHEQIRYEPAMVLAILVPVARRLLAAARAR